MHLSNSCRITSRLLSVPQRRHVFLAINKRRSASVAGAMKVEEGHRLNSRSVQSILAPLEVMKRPRTGVPLLAGSRSFALLHINQTRQRQSRQS